MTVVGRQHEALDLILLKAEWSEDRWKDWIKRHVDRNDIGTLKKTAYSLQAGMKDLASKKQNTDKMVEWFVWMQRTYLSCT